MQEIKFGIIAAPDFPTELANWLANDLPPFLRRRFGENVSWKIEVITDPLTAVAEESDKMIKEAQKHSEGKA